MTRDEMIEKLTIAIWRDGCAGYSSAKMAKSALEAIEAAGGWAPEGSVVVPVDPTDKIRAAAVEETGDNPNSIYWNALYSAMIAAAKE